MSSLARAKEIGGARGRRGLTTGQCAPVSEAAHRMKKGEK